MLMCCMFRVFHTHVPFLYLLKTSENQMFSDIFRGYRNEILAQNASKNSSIGSHQVLLLVEAAGPLFLHVTLHNISKLIMHTYLRPSYYFLIYYEVTGQKPGPRFLHYTNPFITYLIRNTLQCNDLILDTIWDKVF